MNTPFINLTTPQAVLAAVPMLMRFVVINSVVAIMFAHIEHPAPTVPKVTLRFDITVTTAQAAAMPTTANLTAQDYSGALLIAICDPEFDSHAVKLLDAARDALQRRDIPVTARLSTHTLTAPDQWIDRDTGGKALSMHRIKPDLRLVYRTMDKTSEQEPDRLVVLTIQKM
jgi:hypothetical protein